MTVLPLPPSTRNNHSAQAPAMQVRCVLPNELSQQTTAAWRRLLTHQPVGDSPFFDPDYLKLLGKYRRELQVALWEAEGQLRAVFAFERSSSHRAIAPGFKLSDFHGPIHTPGVQVSPEALLEQCGLRSWHFDHQPSNPDWTKWTVRTARSRYIDLADGYEEYARWVKSQTSLFSQVARKRRKLEREAGPIEFRWHTQDDGAFEKLLEWKSAQRERTGTFDVLQVDEIVAFLDEVRRFQSPHLRGVLSTLTVNNQLAAVHLGLATPTAFHYWFPTYSAAFHRYSPGLILLLQMVEEAAEQGIKRFDFGKGEESYKQSFANGAFELAEGAVDFAPWSHFARKSAYRLWKWIQASPLSGPANHWKRWLKRRRAESALNTKISSDVEDQIREPANESAVD